MENNLPEKRESHISEKLKYTAYEERTLGIVYGWNTCLDACKKSLDGNTGRVALNEKELNSMWFEQRQFDMDSSVSNFIKKICARFGQNPPRAGLDEDKLVEVMLRTWNAMHPMANWPKCLAKVICQEFTPPKMAVPSLEIIANALYIKDAPGTFIDFNKQIKEIRSKYLSMAKAIHDLIEKESKA